MNSNMDRMARASDPPRIPGEGAARVRLDRVRHQGDTVGDARDLMIIEVTDIREEKRIGPDIIGPDLVGYAIEEAAGMYGPGEIGEIVWMEPNDENAHIGIAVRDAVDGRFIPELNICVRLIDRRENDAGLHQHHISWHPWLYYYGRNWYVGKSGDRSLAVRIEAPVFARHDTKYGKRYTDEVELIHSAVQIFV